MIPPGHLEDAGYGEVFCHPDTAADLLEDGLTVDDRPAQAILVGVWEHAHQIKIKVPSSQDWWCYGEHVVRTAARNREIQRQQVVDSVPA